MMNMTITDITLAQLRILAAIVDEGSFSAAAQRIGMTQSGASQAIRALEATLGVSLLTRRRGGVVPTEVGRLVLDDARIALLAVERMRQACAAARGSHAGRLRVGSVESAARRILPPLLARFRLLYPAVEVALMEGADDEVLAWVEARAVDVGLTAAMSPGTEGRVIAEDDFLLVVPQDHALAARDRVSLAEVATVPFLMSGGGCAPAVHRLFAAAGVTPEVTLTVRDPLALGRMVAQGLGVTVMPELSIPEGEPGLRRLPLDPPARRRLLAVTHRAPPPPPVAGPFLELLAGPARRGAARTATA